MPAITPDYLIWVSFKPEIPAEAPKPVDPDMDRGCNVKELFKPPIIALAPRPTPTVADAPPPTYFPAKAPAGMSVEGANTNQTICSVFVTSRSAPILVISPYRTLSPGNPRDRSGNRTDARNTELSWSSPATRRPACQPVRFPRAPIRTVL